MYTKEYSNNGKTVTLKENGTKKYVVEIIDGGANCTYKLKGSDDKEITFRDDEPKNVFEYINVSINDFDDILSIDDINCSVDKNINTNSDVVFPFVNFRFKDGSRELLHFCIVKKSGTTTKTVKYDYSIGSSSKLSTITYTIGMAVNSIDTNNLNYYLVPRGENGVDLGETSTSLSNIPLYCTIIKRNKSNASSDSSNVYKTIGEISLNDYSVDNLFVEYNMDNSYDLSNLYVTYDNLANNADIDTIIKSIKKLKNLNGGNSNKLTFYGEDFINGDLKVYEYVKSENSYYYKYIGTCKISKLYPKIEIDIHKNNNSDIDYVLGADRNRAENVHNIDYNHLSKSLVLLKETSSVNTNVYDVPLYDVTVSSYMSKNMIDDGYDFGVHNVYIGSGTNVYTAQSYGNTASQSKETYKFKTETFKVNPSNLPPNNYWRNNISANSTLTHTEHFYIMKNNVDFVDYSQHNININEDNRLVSKK